MPSTLLSMAFWMKVDCDPSVTLQSLLRAPAAAPLHTALDLGVNLIDTARAYGRSEQVVGEGLRSWSGTQPFVVTKIQPLGPKDQFAIPLPVEEVFPQGWVTESAETSLRELGRDRRFLHRLLTSHRFAISLSNAVHWPIAPAEAMM